MTEPVQSVSLDEVRARFLEAEGRLAAAAAATEEIREAAGSLGTARAGVAEAAARLEGLAASLADVSSALLENATNLRAGVDAIRAGDPAQVRRQIEELDSSFTAMQSVVGEGFATVGQQQLTAAARSDALDASLATIESRARRERLGAAAVIAALVLVTIVLQVVLR